MSKRSVPGVQVEGVLAEEWVWLKREKKVSLFRSLVVKKEGSVWKKGSIEGSVGSVGC
jgi:hypothetical protein